MTEWVMVGGYLRDRSKLTLPPVTRLYVHDLDGPLRDPRTGLIDNRLPLQMVHAINRGSTAQIINTGRDGKFIEQYLSFPLLSQASYDHSEFMGRIVGIGEKAAVSVTAKNPWGEFNITINEDLAVPRDLREAVVKRVLADDPTDGPNFSGIVRAEPKLAMVTFSAKEDSQLAQFRDMQEALSDVVGKIIFDSGYKKIVEIDTTSNAVDVQRIGSGKGPGFELGFGELQENGVEFSPDCEVIGFGDSASDAEMIAKAQELGFERVIYVHVGEKDIDPAPFPVIRPYGINTAGTWAVQASIEGVETDARLARARRHAERGEVEEVSKLLGMGTEFGIGPRIRNGLIAAAYTRQADAYLQAGEIASAEQAMQKVAFVRMKIQAGV